MDEVKEKCEIRKIKISGNPNQPAIMGKTYLKIQHFRADGIEVIEDHEEIYNLKFTTAAAEAIVDAFTGAFTLSSFNYHDSGTGTNGEDKSDIALQIPTGEARVSGAQSQPSANIYQSEATITYASGYTITEHGIFSASGSGILLDRTVFAGKTMGAGESLKFTFQLTFAGEN